MFRSTYCSVRVLLTFELRTGYEMIHIYAEAIQNPSINDKVMDHTSCFIASDLEL